MKAKVLSIALTLIALFVFGSAQAQHLNDDYVATFNSESGVLTVVGKVGGLGAKKRTAELTFSLETEVSGGTCEKEIVRKKKGVKIIEHPGGGGGETSSSDEETIIVGKGKGSDTFTVSLSIGAEALGKCPNENSGFTLSEYEVNFLEATVSVDGGAEVVLIVNVI